MSEARSRKGWPRVSFGDVVRLSRERSGDPENEGFERYVGLDHIDPGDLTIRRWGNVSDGTTFTNVFRAGQVLFGKRRAYQRKVAVPDFDGVCSGDIYVLEPKNDQLLRDLLPFICQTDGFFDHAVGTSAGSLSPRTNWDSLASYEFALPPLDEQRKVADVLRESESLIQSLHTLAHSLRATATALVEDMIRRAPNTALDSVAELLIEPPRNGVSPPANADGAGLRTVSISAVSAGVFEPSGCVKHAHIDPAAARPFFVRQGDVFVVRGNGNRLLCGKAGLTDRSYDDLFYPDLLIRLRFDPKKILPGFAVTQWNLPSVHARLSARAKSSNGIWKVNGQDIRAHQLLAPPIDKQKSLMETVTKLQVAAGAAAERAKAAAGIKKAVLSKAAGI